VTGPAVRAPAAADGRGDHHAVAGSEVPDVAAELFDSADRLVAENGPRAHTRHRPADKMQVGAADRAAGDPYDRVRPIEQLGLCDLLEADLAYALPDDSLHRTGSFLAGPLLARPLIGASSAFRLPYRLSAGLFAGHAAARAYL
jgi:hypothetical protein